LLDAADASVCRKRAALLVGRASQILVSANITGNWLPRFERFGKSLCN